MIISAKSIIESPDKFDKDMAARNENIRATDISQLYQNWRSSLQELETVAHELNQLSKQFNEAVKERCVFLGQRKAELAEKTDTHKRDLDSTLDRIPNWLDNHTPIGRTDADNRIVGYHHPHTHASDVPHQYKHCRHHEDIAEELGFWCRKEAVDMSGSRFIVLTGKLAQLERALIQFVMDCNLKSGFTEVSVPFLVRPNALYNAGQLPKFANQFFMCDQDYALIPTGEVPLINLVAGQTIQNLPMKLTTHTPCFRREAGSLGRDTKGLIRLHQFHKVEIVAITEANASSDIHLEMLEHIKHILDLLKLPYRVVEVCSGEIAFTALRQFDIEAWMPGQAQYIEVASCSNCGDFQARRMGTKDENGEYVHTLNGTAIACGRIIAAILENTCADGHLVIPEVLQKYFKE
jgi:seryl-tRNA synthetase